MSTPGVSAVCTARSRPGTEMPLSSQNVSFSAATMACFTFSGISLSGIDCRLCTKNVLIGCSPSLK